MGRWLWLSGLVLVLDQLTKRWADAQLVLHQPKALTPFLSLALAYNRGAAFSLLSDQGGWQRWLFVALAAAASLGILIWILRLGRRDHLIAAALALILGGALGNLTDRLLLGYVVDFIDFQFRSLGGWPGFTPDGHWPAFNLADSAIDLGAVLLVIDALRPRRAPH